MANMCYTDYWIEGSKRELTRLKETIAYYLSIECPAMGRKTTWLGCIRSKIDKPDQKYGRYACREYFISEINNECITDIDDKNGVMHFVTCSAWEPNLSVIQAMMDEFAPHCKLYYYAEELWGEVCFTNDTSKKYFNADYTIMCNWEKNEKMPDGVLEIFYDKANLRKREDQNDICITYWTAKELKAALMQLFGFKNMFIWDMISRCNQLMKEHFGNKRHNSFLSIYPVEFVSPKNLMLPASRKKDYPCYYHNHNGELIVYGDFSQRRNKHLETIFTDSFFSLTANITDTDFTLADNVMEKDGKYLFHTPRHDFNYIKNTIIEKYPELSEFIMFKENDPLAEMMWSSLGCRVIVFDPVVLKKEDNACKFCSDICNMAHKPK